MSRERLSEHFSDLYEGSIDPGLSQQIKNRFDSDFDLKADFDQFAETMDLLDSMKDETIEVPQHLSSMIADRLEANAKKPAFSFNFSLRNLGFGALACVAIASAVFAIKNQNTGSAIPAGVVSGSSGPAVKRVENNNTLKDSVDIKMVNKNAVLMYDSSGVKSIRVSNAEDQKLIKKYDLDGNNLACPLDNSETNAAAFLIEVNGDSTKHVVVVPGTGRDYEAVGKGNLLTFIKLLATKYNQVIHVQVAKANTDDLQWDVKDENPQLAASAVLSTAEYTVTTSNDGILIIQSH